MKKAGLGKCIAAALVALFAGGSILAVDKYRIDPSHTNIQFAVQHLVISKVKGTFPEISGTILYDEKEIGNSSVKVAIQTASIDTGNEDRDKHLRSADFFDAAQYPEITFESSEIRSGGSGFVALGTLTMRGVSRQIELPFEIVGKVTDPWGNTRIGIRAEYGLDRLEYEISWSKTLDAGGLVVGNQVEIELNLEAVLEKPQS